MSVVLRLVHFDSVGGFVRWPFEVAFEVAFELALGGFDLVLPAHAAVSDLGDNHVSIWEQASKGSCLCINYHHSR